MTKQNNPKFPITAAWRHLEIAMHMLKPYLEEPQEIPPEKEATIQALSSKPSHKKKM